MIQPPTGFFGYSNMSPEGQAGNQSTLHLNWDLISHLGLNLFISLYLAVLFFTLYTTHKIQYEELSLILACIFISALSFLSYKISRIRSYIETVSMIVCSLSLNIEGIFREELVGIWYYAFEIYSIWMNIGISLYYCNRITNLICKILCLWIPALVTVVLQELYGQVSIFPYLIP